MVNQQKVFISYSSKDQESVDQLKKTLDKLTVPYWIDDFLYRERGSIWQVEILEIIKQATHFVLVVSAASAESFHVGVEHGMFMMVRELDNVPERKLVPVMIGETPIPAHFNSLNIIKLTLEEGGIDQSSEDRLRELLPIEGRRDPDEAGIKHIYNRFPFEQFREAIAKLEGGEIRIMQTWIPHLTQFQDALTTALEKGIKVHFLLLDPETSHARQRGLDLFQDEEEVVRKINTTIQEIRDWYESTLETLKKQIVLRLYRALPKMSIYLTLDDQDDGETLHGIVGFYFHNRAPLENVRLQLTGSANIDPDLFVNVVDEQFQDVWSRSSNEDLSKPRDISPPRTSDGNPTKGRSVSPSNAGLRYVHDGDQQKEITEEIIRRIHKARRRIWILQTYVPDLESYENALVKAVENKARIRFLLLDPNAEQIIEQRQVDSDKRWGPRGFKDEIDQNLTALKAMAKRHEDIKFHERVKVRLYTALPSLATYITDNNGFVFLFWNRMLAMEGPSLELVHKDDALFISNLAREYFALWYDDNTRSFSLISEDGQDA